MPFNKSQFDAGILQKLGVIANEFMSKMAQKVSQNGLPKKITEHTKADPPQKKGSKYSIDIVIDTSKDAAPMAGAFEYGSGEHGESKERYTIPGMPFLAIPRERWPKFQPPPDVDPVVLGSVEHPGVEARPYIEPTIKEIRKPFKKMFAEEFKRQYLMGTPKVTVIRAKK